MECSWENPGREGRASRRHGVGVSVAQPQAAVFPACPQSGVEGVGETSTFPVSCQPRRRGCKLQGTSVSQAQGQSRLGVQGQSWKVSRLLYTGSTGTHRAGGNVHTLCTPNLASLRPTKLRVLGASSSWTTDGEMRSREGKWLFKTEQQWVVGLGLHAALCTGIQAFPLTSSHLFVTRLASFTSIELIY
jgi:hypothetical protein